MKVTVTSILAVLATTIALGTQAHAQARQAAPAASAPHKVGLIDMAHVFQEYEKFKVLREDLKAEIERTDAQARQSLDQVTGVQTRIKEFKQGSPEYVQLEKQLLDAKSKYDAFRAGAQRDLMRKESKIYKQIYLEVSDAVKKYADVYSYTLIMRFSRKTVDDSTTPPEIVQGMNKQVVYFRSDDDITDKVLRYLNNQYQNTGGGSARPRQPSTPGRQAGGTPARRTN